MHNRVTLVNSQLDFDSLSLDSAQAHCDLSEFLPRQRNVPAKQCAMEDATDDFKYVGELPDDFNYVAELPKSTKKVSISSPADQNKLDEEDDSWVLNLFAEKEDVYGSSLNWNSGVSPRQVHQAAKQSLMVAMHVVSFPSETASSGRDRPVYEDDVVLGLGREPYRKRNVGFARCKTVENQYGTIDGLPALRRVSGKLSLKPTL